MAVHRIVRSVSYPAGGDLSASQFGVVYLSDEGRITVNTGASTPCLGILLNKPTAVDQAARVAIDGSIVKCIAALAINERDAIQGVATGHGSSTVASNAYIVGHALSAASGTGVPFELLVGCDRLGTV